jgi:hypothetical protein
MAEGRWPAFVECREGYKQQGKSPVEAHVLALAKFQPLDGTEATAAVGARPAKSDKRVKTPNVRADMLWVYDNLDVKEPKGAPSKGALAMHKQVHQSSDTRWEFLILAIQRFVSPRAPQEPAPNSLDKEQTPEEIEEGQAHLQRVLAEIDEKIKRENPPGEHCPGNQCRWLTLRHSAGDRSKDGRNGSSPSVALRSNLTP